MLRELRELLKAEVALVKPIRQKIRSTHGRERYDAWDEKRERRDVRRALNLAICWVKGTPYERTERKPRVPPNADEIANVLPGGSRTDPVQSAEIASWIGGGPSAPREERVQLQRLYVVVRADLLPGSQAVQAAHAMREFAARHPEVEAEWHRTSNTVVMLSVPDEVTLTALQRRLHDDEGVKIASFYEPDLGGALTAICVEPAGGRFLRGLPLALRAPSSVAPPTGLEPASEQI